MPIPVVILCAVGTTEEQVNLKAANISMKF
jgi:hypothetical protein